MAVIFLFLGAVGFGFLLIFLIAVTAPKPEKVDLREESGGSELVELDSEQLGQLVANLTAKMGLEIERWQGGKNELIEIFAVNPTPVTGGKVLIHCLTAPELTGKVDGVRIGKFIRAVRAAYVTKGILFTTGTFTPDAHLEAEDAPIEIFDRPQIQRMVDRYFEDGDVLAAIAEAELPSPSA